jgi:hypothetical protein
MSKSARIEQMVQKMLFCFTNISAEILLHIFRLHFFAPSALLWCLFAKWLPFKKHLKLSAQKLLCFGAKSVGEIDIRMVCHYQLFKA